MKLVMTRTGQFNRLPGGALCEVWVGETEKHVQCTPHVFGIGWPNRGLEHEFKFEDPAARMAIQSTEEIRVFNGTPCRRWYGVTNKGVECTVYVAGIGFSQKADMSESESDLTPLKTLYKDIVTVRG